MHRFVGLPTAAKSGARRRRRSQTVAAAAAVVCASVAGCSSAGGVVDAKASACTTPGITRNAVHLGLLFSNSGPFASTFEGFRGAVDARIDVQNAQGGVNGRSITYDWADDGGGADANLIGAQTLVGQKNDFAVIEGSTNEQGSAPYLAQHGIPVTGAGPSKTWTSYPNVLSWASLSSPTAITTAWGEVAKQRAGTKVAVLSVVFIPSSQQLALGIASSMQAAGLAIAYQNLQLSQTTSLPALAEAIVRSHADVVTGVLSPQIWAALAPALRAAGADLKLSIFPTGYDQASLATLGAAQAGTDFAVDAAPFELDLPAHRAFLRAMAAYAPQIQPPQNELALGGWLAADLMIRGLQEGGACPTRQSLIDTLRKTSYDGNGLVNPPANLSDYRAPSPCLYVIQVSADGTRYVPQGTAPVCGQIRPRS